MSAQLVAGRYRLQSVLGHGGMAKVWRAVDERLDRPVAVKVLANDDPTTVQRFDLEARAIARLTHHNVVAVHDVGVDGDHPYLVMELVDGQSVAALLAAGPLRVDEAVRIGVQVCDALAAAHAAGVVHRDVKPANILTTPNGEVKVCDFGIAHLPQSARVSLTGAGHAVGTSDYMSPEQATGAPVDARTDLYALGCVLYAMLVGGPPFRSDSALGVVWQHVNQQPVPVAALRPEIPAALAELIGQLMAKDPADRPATAHEVRDRLANLSGRAMGTARPVAAAAVFTPTQTMPTVDTPTGAFRLGPPVVAGVAVIAVIAALLITAVLADDGPGPQIGAAPTPTAAATPSATVDPVDRPDQAIAAVYAAIDAQRQAGQLDADAARELTKQTDEVAREVARGRQGKAAERADELRSELGKLRREGQVGAAGYDAIRRSIDQLTDTLPANDTDDG